MEEKALTTTEGKNDSQQVSLRPMQSIFLDPQRFEFAQRIGKMLASATMVPDHFRNNLGNCLIALNLSERLNVDAFMLMQTLYVVHGKPGIESKLGTALFNERTKLFIPPLRYEKEGDYPHGKDARCRAYAKDKASGETTYGEWIDWPMIEAEGWASKNGSKWKTMPGQMFVYRAAMFFIREYEAGVLLGLQTKEELEDMIIDVTPERRTLKVDESTGEIEEGKDIYETKEAGSTPETITIPTGPETKSTDSWPCDECNFTSATERGLKKHKTQSHKTGTTEPAEEPPPFEPDPELPETTSAEAHSAAARGLKPISEQINDIMNEMGAAIGASKYADALIAAKITKEGGGWLKATPLQQEAVFKYMSAALDEQNAGQEE